MRIFDDFRFSLRALLKNPVFTIVVVLTFALAVGPNSVVFGVLNAVILRPLPYTDPGELVMVWNRFEGMGKLQPNFSKPEMVDLREQSEAFGELGAWGYGMSQLTGQDEPIRLQTGWLSANLLDLLGKSALIGRTFTALEHQPGNDRVAILNHGTWQRRFGGSSEAIGKSINLDGEIYTIIGVMPADFQLPLDYQWSGRTSLYLPLLDPRDTDRRTARFLYVLGRLRDGVGLGQAQANLDTIAQRFRREHPDTYATGKSWQMEVRSLEDETTADIRPALLLLLGSVLLVLLIASTNLINLLLARMTRRERELSIRAAMGAGRLQVTRQMLTENLILGMLGGIVGGLLAYWGLSFLVGLVPGNIPRLDEVRFDGAVIRFIVLFSLILAIILTLAPVLRSGKIALTSVLREGSRGATESGRQQRVRRLLVVLEVALAVVALIGAGLMIRSFRNLIDVDVGFDAKKVLYVVLGLPSARYPEESKAANFYEELRRRVGALPGVESVGGISHLPFHISPPQQAFTIESLPASASATPPTAGLQSVTPGYFRTLAIAVRAGREFTEDDRREGMPVAMVNELLARRYWPNDSAVGRRIKLYNPEESDFEYPWLTIVGVVANAKQTGFDAEDSAEIYVPYRQVATSANEVRRYMTLVLRTAGDPVQVFNPVKDEVWKLDRDLPLSGGALETRLANSVARPRFTMILLMLFGGLALALAAVGLYGVMAYSVAQRTREIGVRMALGARRQDVLRMVVREGLSLVATGLAIGLVVAFWLSGLLKSVLYGVARTDLATLALVTGLLTGVALLASLIPAWRATRVEPVEVLRHE